MKNIVIIGSGYGGVAVAKGLQRRGDLSVTLIDRRNYHLYAPNLYEVATAEEEFASVADLKKSIAIPLKEIFTGNEVQLKQAEITEINPTERTVTAGVSKIPYDYLVLAAGSVTEYFSVKGAKEFSLPLKTLTDAFAIRNRLEFAFEAKALAFKKDNIRIVVAGGGYTGCEFAAQLADLVEILCWKYGFSFEKVEIVIVEAANEVISGLSEKLSLDAWLRLKELGVRVMLSSPIFSVDQHFVYFLSGEKLGYDALVWTTGIKGALLPFTTPLETDRRGRIIVNEFLQAKTDERIFAVGDCAAALDNQGRPMPQTAPNAIDQGRYVSGILPQLIQNHKPQPYKAKFHGFIVALGGRWAILKTKRLYMKGWLMFFIRTMVNLHYYWQVVGLWKAVKYVWLQWEEYGRSD